MSLIHGGDIESYRSEYGRVPLDFSSNCSPLGVPRSVRRAVRTAVPEADRYPDHLCRKLRAALAGHMNVAPDAVLCGNGAADLIHRLVRAARPKRAVVTAPAFAEYELALAAEGCSVSRLCLRRENGFALTTEIFDVLKTDTDLLFLCNPNNPTGKTIDSGLLHEILDFCETHDVLLILDECFNGFLDRPERHTLREQASGSGNLVVVDAFTKLYGMAGLRLGYCLSGNAGLINAVRNMGQPWPVSSLAQRAGTAALKDQKYKSRVRALIRQEKPGLVAFFEEHGIGIFGSEANYLFFYADNPQLDARLKENGILIRNCANYHGLSPGYYRMSVRTHRENRRFMEVLSEIIPL